MSVASSSLANPTRVKALMVRLSPNLVEAVCELTRALKDKTHAQTEISGLLFGKSQDGMLAVEALKTFKDSSGPRSDLARRERMEKSFTAAMALANEDPEFAAFKLLGWFSLRGGGGLINSDVEFHNRHFKNGEDVALIVWREGDTQITAELYASVETGKLTTEDYRWSSVRLSTEMRHVSQPVDLVMRVRMNDDLYLRTYGVSDGRERKDEWKKIAESAKRTLLSLLPGHHSDVVYPEDLPLPPPTGTAKRSFESRTLFRGVDAEPSAPSLPSAAPAKPPAPKPPPTSVTPAATVSAPRPPALASEAAASSVVPHDVNRAPRPKAVPEISGLPMVIKPRKLEPKATPWLSMAFVFVLCSGVTFAVLALKTAGTGDGKLSQIMKVLFPGSELELHAASRGESLELSWNRRNPVVANSAYAVLAVTDGPKHFERKLDPDLVSEGVVSYKPVSGDVTFQLRVYGTDQAVAFGKLRVLDATSPAVSDAASKPAPDLTSATPAAESNSAVNTTPSPALPAATREPSAAPPASKVNLPAFTAPLMSTPVSKPPLPPDTWKSARTKTTPQTPAPTLRTQPQPQVQQPVQTATQQQPALTPPVSAASKQATARPTSNGNIAPQTSNTAINGWDANLPENKPAPPQPQSPAPPDGKTVDFVGPKVLLQVMPNTRSLTPGLITEVTRVEVEVRVDASGHVKAAHLGNPNVKSPLGAAAVAAAKQWTFQPATLRGQHVDSDHTIVFEFRPEGQ